MIDLLGGRYQVSASPVRHQGEMQGAGDMQCEELDVYTLGQSVVGRLQSEAEKAEVTISAEGEATRLYCMPALLETIIYDLCDNAIKYNRPGGWVKLEVGRIGDDAKICVSDNGIGIPAADHKRIFECFYRVDKSHSRSIGGTGLGLSIVKHAVSLHGGRIDLQSNVDNGTMMTVWLPLSANKK